MSHHAHHAWADVDGVADDGEAALPAALTTASGRRLVRAGIYDAGDWYDVDYAGYVGELRFYRRVCDTHGGVGHVVELGAGTGRLSVPLATSGHTVWAVEPAIGMRDVLCAKVDRLGLSDAIVVEDALAHTFAGPPQPPTLVLFPFNGILHLMTRADLDESLAHVRRRLAPQGVFALDMTGPYWESVRRGRIPWGRVDQRVHPHSGRSFLTCDRSAYHAGSRVMRIDIRYALEADDTLIETALFQRMWTTTEVIEAVERVGMRVEEAFGDVDLSAFHEGAPRLMLIARAP
jgi:hypothetical protein